MEKSTTAEINGENVNVFLRIFDTSGQEDYAAIRPGAYNEVNVCLIAFSTISQNSYDNVQITWMKEKNKYMEDAKIVLIGTKCDLKDATGEIRKGLEDAGMAIGNPVTVAQGQALSKRIKAFAYCETSAKSGEGIKDAFNKAILAAAAPSKTPKCGCILL